MNANVRHCFQEKVILRTSEGCTKVAENLHTRDGQGKQHEWLGQRSINGLTSMERGCQGSNTHKWVEKLMLGCTPDEAREAITLYKEAISISGWKSECWVD